MEVERGERSIYDTLGALDMGGASTQITFVPEEGTQIVDGSYPFKLGGKEYSIYARYTLWCAITFNRLARSYLTWGLNEARHRLIDAVIVKRTFASGVQQAV